jgi:hypothetical protein
MTKLCRGMRMHILWLAPLLTALGCGGTYDSSVSGVVTLDGKIVPTGTVSFTPSSAGPTAFSLIAADGKYSVRTGRESGLPPGQYSVSVTANEPPAALRSKDGGPAPLGKPITPEWYRNPTTSGLSYDVKPGENEINLELKSAPPPGWKPSKRR